MSSPSDRATLVHLGSQLQATEDRESIQRRASIVANAVEWAMKRCSANASDELEQLAWANSASDVSASNTTPGERLRVTRLEAELSRKLRAQYVFSF